MGLSKVLYFLRSLAPVILTIICPFENGHYRQAYLKTALSLSDFLASCDKIVYGEEKRTLFGGWVVQKFLRNQDFVTRQII